MNTCKLFILGNATELRKDIIKVDFIVVYLDY